METLQKRFMNALNTRAKAKGLDLVVSYNYSNCGLFHFMRPGSFEETLLIPFDFQPGRVTLGWMVHDFKKGVRAVFPQAPNPYYAGFKAGEMDDAITALLEAAA